MKRFLAWLTFDWHPLPTWSGTWAPLFLWRQCAAGWLRYFARWIESRGEMNLRDDPHFEKAMLITHEQYDELLKRYQLLKSMAHK